jgi:hypothetical protein
MGLLSRLFGKPKDEPSKEKKTDWPNGSTWAALRSEVTISTEQGPRFLWTVACGDLLLPSGRLVACDPFVFLQPRDNPHVIVPQGRFPVIVTLADVSPAQDRSHTREAYASVIFAQGQEAHRKALALVQAGQERPELTDGDYIGFGVDAGTACFVDDATISACMPDPDTWYEELFENDRADCWFKQMDDPGNIREGIANIVLPLAKQGENIVLFHSGWGDGTYPVVGSFDQAGRLLAVHIDFFVVE